MDGFILITQLKDMHLGLAFRKAVVVVHRAQGIVFTLPMEQERLRLLLFGTVIHDDTYFLVDLFLHTKSLKY